MVADLDAAVADLGRRGIAGGPAHPEGDGARKACFTDPDGNEVSLIAVSSVHIVEAHSHSLVPRRTVGAWPPPPHSRRPAGGGWCSRSAFAQTAACAFVLRGAVPRAGPARPVRPLAGRGRRLRRRTDRGPARHADRLGRRGRPVRRAAGDGVRPAAGRARGRDRRRSPPVSGTASCWPCSPLGGAAAASVFAACGRMIMGWFPRTERGLAMGIRQTAQPLGVAVAGLVLPGLAQRTGCSAPWLVPAALCLLSALLVIGFAPDPVRPPRAPGDARRPRPTAPRCCGGCTRPARCSSCRSSRSAPSAPSTSSASRAGAPRPRARSSR